MEGQPDKPAEEIKRLRRCINDLVSLLALPATLSGCEPSQIVRTVRDVLLGMVNLDLLYIRLEDPAGGSPMVETIWSAQWRSAVVKPQEMRELLNQCLGPASQNWPPSGRVQIEGIDISIAPFRLGLQGEVGIIVAGSQRLDFPGQTERLMLSVAANQAVIWLQEARLLSEQKRVAQELDQRVAQRTAELQTANEALVADITARKEMERALRQSEEQYRVVVESANEAVVSIDETSRILFANTATARIFGHPVGDLIGQPLMTLMAASFRPLHNRAIGRYLETGRRNIDWRGTEVRGRRKNGEEFPIEVSFGEIAKDGHRIFTGCIRDITERKKSEAIEAAQAKKSAVRAAVSAAFAEADNLRIILNSCAEATVRHLGAAFARIWTLDEDENMLVLQASAGLYTRLDGTHARVPMGQFKIGRIAEEGKPHLTNDVPNDERVSDRDWAKREGMVAFAGYPLFIEGRAIGVIAMFARSPLDQTILEALESAADIIAQGIRRKDAEDKLRRSEAYLAEAQKLSLTGSFGWKVSSDEHIWSDETFRIFEYDASIRVTLQMILERVHPEDLPMVRQTVEHALHSEKNWDIEYRLLMPGGTVKHVHVVAHAIDGDSGNREFVGAVMDITATRRAEDAMRRGQAELAHASRLTTLGEFAASIAHEVNQPLAAIVNNTNACLGLLPDSDPRLEEVRIALGEMIEDAGRASAVITGIRQLARKSQVNRVPLAMEGVVADVLALVRYESRTRRVTTRFELSEKLPPVLGDRVQLKQVLLNLIVNGMDAMNTTEESKRVLTIDGRSEMENGAPVVILSVQDAGIGLKPDERDRLFEAFYTTKPQGLGMGLAISRSIIEAHGGRLWAETNQGAGANFLFSLPTAEAAMV